MRSIVCGVDFSSGSRKALRAAVDPARANRSALTVLFSEDSDAGRRREGRG